MPGVATMEVRVADVLQVKALIDAVADLFNDPYEAELHTQCAHDPCTYRQLRMRAEELAGI